MFIHTHPLIDASYSPLSLSQGLCNFATVKIAHHREQFPGFTTGVPLNAYRFLVDQVFKAAPSRGRTRKLPPNPVCLANIW